MNVEFSPPDITEKEIEAVTQALRSGWITTGPRTKEFERRIAQYCHTKRAVCLNSATACLEMTLRILGIGEGDEVITTAYTYTATCSSICHVGAMPVLVDTIPDSFEMDPEKVRGAVTRRTKAIISVDLAGVIYSGYDELFQIAEEKKNLYNPASLRQKAMGRIVIIADAAHAFGAVRKEKMCGQFADFTCFSFHAVKNLTTAEGGAVTWSQTVARAGIDAEELYREYMLLSLHGQSKDALEKTKAGGWEYDIVAPYYKCNMTDIMASIGLVQLERYPSMLKRRRELIDQYDRQLEGCPVKLLSHYGEGQSSGHLYLLRILDKTRKECNNTIIALAEKGVTSNVHYKPLPMLTAYKRMGFAIEDYPNAYGQFENEVTLPLHTCMTDEQVRYVTQTFKKLL